MNVIGRSVQSPGIVTRKDAEILKSVVRLLKFRKEPHIENLVGK